jgi:hypothetical protein
LIEKRVEKIGVAGTLFDRVIAENMTLAGSVKQFVSSSKQ